MKIKLKNIREEANYHSQRVSDGCQKLAIAGLAIIWLFHLIDDSGMIMLSWLLFVSMILFILSILIDIMQNALLSHKWSKYYGKKNIEYEKAGHTNIEDIEVTTPEGLGFTGWLLYWFKLGFLVVGYILLFIDIIGSFEIV